MKEYSEVMESCKEINNIMDDIASLLEENSIDFTRNASANEIIVSNETKKNMDKCNCQYADWNCFRSCQFWY